MVIHSTSDGVRTQAPLQGTWITVLLEETLIEGASSDGIDHRWGHLSVRRSSIREGGNRGIDVKWGTLSLTNSLIAEFDQCLRLGWGTSLQMDFSTIAGRKKES